MVKSIYSNDGYCFLADDDDDTRGARRGDIFFFFFFINIDLDIN